MLQLLVIFLIDGIQIFSESLKNICRIRSQLIMTIMHMQPKHLYFSFFYLH